MGRLGHECFTSRSSRCEVGHRPPRNHPGFKSHTSPNRELHQPCFNKSPRLPVSAKLGDHLHIALRIKQAWRPPYGTPFKASDFQPFNMYSSKPYGEDSEQGYLCFCTTDRSVRLSSRLITNQEAERQYSTIAKLVLDTIECRDHLQIGLPRYRGWLPSRTSLCALRPRGPLSETRRSAHSLLDDRIRQTPL